MSEQEVDPLDVVEETAEPVVEDAKKEVTDDNGPGSSVPGGH